MAHRKPRPKFELPVEPEAAVHDVGWVYRAPEDSSNMTAEAPQPTAATPVNRTASGFVVMAGVGVFAVGIVTAGMMSLAAFSAITMPVRMARRFLASR